MRTSAVTRSLPKRALLSFAATGVVLATSLVAVAPAHALGFSSVEIVDQARSYDLGSQQGGARDFAIGAVVNPILSSHGLATVAGAGATGGEYYGAYQAAGAVLVSLASAQPGDLIQTIADASKNSDNPPVKGLNTAIIVSTAGQSGNFVVRDSNSQGDNKVRERVWPVASWAQAQGAAVYVWRFGSSLTNLIGTIVQWPGNPNTSWLVYPDLTRRWIPTPQVYECLVSNGVVDSGVQPASVLSQLPDHAWVEAACSLPPAPTSRDIITVGRGLSRGVQLTSHNGLFSVSVSPTDGSLVLSKIGGRVLWTAGAGSAYYVLQPDGELVGQTFDNRVTFTSSERPPGRVTEVQLGDDGDLKIVGASDDESVWSSGTTQNVAPKVARGNKLTSGVALLRGHALCSGNGQVCLSHQAGTGALVLRKGAAVVWKTPALDGDWVTVRPDGNLVDYRSDGRVVWSTKTAGAGHTWLSIQNNGSLVLYSGKRAVWDSVHGTL